MKPFFKPKDVLQNEGDKILVKLIKGYPEKEGQYGIPYDVIVGGTEYTWSLDEKKRNKIKQNNCKSEFWVVAYKAGAFIGFNYLPVDCVSAQPGNDVTQKTEQVTQKSNDDHQDKVSRGAAWNNAFAYCLQEGSTKGATPSMFCEEVTKVAEKIAPHQKAFVNGAVKEEVVPDPAPGPEPEKKDTYDYNPDLPF